MIGSRIFRICVDTTFKFQHYYCCSRYNMDNWTRLLISLEAKESPLLPDPRYTRSEHTKPPAPYHHHLSPNLVPRYAKVLEDLAGDLVEDTANAGER
jgi:hypothetical protein